MSRKFFVWVSLSFATALLLAGCQAGGFEMTQIFQGLATPTWTATPIYTPIPAATPTPTPIPPPFDLRETDNLLLLGTDRRPNDGSWRTDTIMVVGIDRLYNRAAVLSIPRDLYLAIPGYGQYRINQLDYLGEAVWKVPGGGPAILSQVIEDNLGLTTNHWVRVEMDGFEQVVDTLGGVTVELDCPFYELIYDLDEQKWDYFTLPAGEVVLDGESARWFVRLRLIESDFGRARRQRQFLWALREQVLSRNQLLRIPELWNAFQNAFGTDLSLLQMLDLTRFAVGLEPQNVRAAAITDKQVDRFIAPSGADVLVINDPSKIEALIDAIWEGESLAEANRTDPASCPPPPKGVPNYVQTLLTPTAVVPAEDAQPEATPTPGG
ncbi:MAG: LCP family protein [Caldilineaceae bacterium]|nr:LCP family protein [Caldilineaceae bacterium]HRJ43389.1 LCP family protein [Caldilineaceae bacterium]